MSVENVRPTRYPELGYTKSGNDWRIVATDGNAAVGPCYKSKAELLADLERYAQEYGCAPKHAMVNHTNGMMVLGRYHDTIFIQLPVELRVPTPNGTCGCYYCEAHPNEPPTWDTLCVPMKDGPGEYGHTWTVHMPDKAAFFKSCATERGKK
jgi:hypothetical protein